MTQYAHARRTDPLESHLAAEKASEKLTEVQRRIISLLEIHGPMTDEQLIAAFGRTWPGFRVTAQSIRSRRAELVKKERVEFSGRFGVSATGQRARMWRVTDAA